MFDFDEAFSDFMGLFKRKGDQVLARALWDTQVNGSEGDELAATAHAAVIAAMTPKARSEWNPDFALKRLLGARLPGTEPPKVVAAKPAEVAAAAKPVATSLFQQFWASRPVNPVNSPESRSEALTHFQMASKRHGEDTVCAALRAFLAEEQFKENPRWLSTILKDADLVARYAEIERYVPGDVDTGLFRRAWAKYPGTKPIRDLKEEIGKVAQFARAVPADETLRFFAAIEAYNRQRREDDDDEDDFERYSIKWPRFVSGHWREVECGRELGGLVMDALSAFYGRPIACSDFPHDAFRDGFAGTPAEAIESVVAAYNAHLREQREEYDAAEPRDSVVGWQKSDKGSWIWVASASSRWESVPLDLKETDRLIRDTVHLSNQAYACHAKPCRCYCKSRSSYRPGGCGWQAPVHETYDPTCKRCQRDGNPADCGLDPCTCGNRDERHTGNCGRPGCEGEPCVCGRWIPMPPADLPVGEAGAVLGFARKCLAEPVAPAPAEESVAESWEW